MIKKQTHKACVRILGILAACVLLPWGIKYTVPAQLDKHASHSLSLGYSELQDAIDADMDSLEFVIYNDRVTPILTEIPIESSDLPKEAGEEAVQPYRLHRDLADIVDSLRFPLDSGILRTQALQSLENKVLIRFYPHGSAGTGCDFCQAVVVMDPDSGELTMLEINSQEQDCRFQLHIEDEDGREITITSANLVQQEARVEEALTHEELEALLLKGGVEVELLNRWEPEPEEAGHGGNQTGEERPDTELPGGEDPEEEPGTGQSGDEEKEEEPGTEQPGDQETGEEPDTEQPGDEEKEEEPDTEQPGDQETGEEPDAGQPGDEEAEEEPGTEQPDIGVPDEEYEAHESIVEEMQENASDDLVLVDWLGELPYEPMAVGQNNNLYHKVSISATGVASSHTLTLGQSGLEHQDSPADENPPINGEEQDQKDGDDLQQEGGNDDGTPQKDGDTDPGEETPVTYRVIVVKTTEENLDVEETALELDAPGNGLSVVNFQLLRAYGYVTDLEGYNLIYTAADLDGVREDLNGKYRVCNDISLTGYQSSTFTAANGWVGIGRGSADAFSGEFDGGGWVITGLWFSAGNVANQGLFGFAEGAAIYDVRIDYKRALRALYDVGGLVGFARNTSIQDCHVKLDNYELTANYEAGGLVGTADEGTVIENCTVQGGQLTVTGGGYAGGLVGRTNSVVDTAGFTCTPVEIRDCHVYSMEAEGTTPGPSTSGNYAGGLVGSAYKTNITSCTAENITVRSDIYSGGLVGAAQRGTQIIDCHVKGVDSSTKTNYAGGFAGVIYIEDQTVGNGPILTTMFSDCSVEDAIVRADYNYAGGFTGAAYERSALRGCRVDGAEVTFHNEYAGGFAGVIYGQTEASDCTVNNTTVAPNPTTNSAHINGGFAGVIYDDAQVSGCLVSNVEVRSNTDYAAGFAGKVYDAATVTDSHVRGAKVESRTTFAGGFIGESMSTSVIERCSVEDFEVRAIDQSAGGFTTRLYGNSQMIDCYAANGTVNTTRYVGGLLGAASENASVTNCYAQVDVMSGSYADVYAGGLIGNLNGYASIANCYATGSVTAAHTGAVTRVGGLIGNRMTNYTAVSNCYAAGTVLVPSGSTMIGGLIGSTSGTSAISNCYFDTTTTRQLNAIGAGGSTSQITALTTTQMIAGEGTPGEYIAFAYGDTFSENGDTASPWYIDRGATYPYLYFQYNGYSDDERNYNLDSAGYADGGYLGLQADFEMEGTMPFTVTTAGAKRAYFPYPGVSNYAFSDSGTATVPASAFSPDAGLYSLGGVSASNIVAFANGPRAEKTSDRPVYMEGDPESYTYVDDVVEYTIEMTNHSLDYDWENIVLTDPLPKGVALNMDHAVTVQFGNNGETPIGTGGAVPYYAYDEVERELTVYLGTLYRMDSPSGANTVIVRFYADVGGEALSELPPDPAADNIRNRGTVEGTMVSEEFAPFEHKVGFDDRNTDPVFTVRVYYDGNDENVGGTVPEDPAFYRNGDTVTVADEDEMTVDGKFFYGWSEDPGADPADPQAVIYQKGDTFEIGYEDVTLYAVWTTDDPVAFYKVDAQNITKPLPGARFSLYRCTVSSHSGPDDHGRPDDPASCWGNHPQNIESDADGLLQMLMPREVALALVETEAPAGYVLPAGYWVFTLHGDGTMSQVRGVGYVPAIRGGYNPQKPADILYLVTNLPPSEMPPSGGTYLLFAIGIFCLLGGLLLYMSARRKEY